MSDQEQTTPATGVSQEIVGEPFVLPSAYIVGREQVRDFAHAVFATNPIHTDLAAARAAGYIDLVAPTTFLAVLQHRVLAELLADPRFDVELKNVVHGDQRFTFTRPVVAGDELRAELTVSGVRSLGKGTMVQTTTTFTDATDEAVATTTATLVVGGGNNE